VRLQHSEGWAPRSAAKWLLAKPAMRCAIAVKTISKTTKLIKNNQKNAKISVFIQAMNTRLTEYKWSVSRQHTVGRHFFKLAQ
jgi:hypothetical protein